MSARLFRVILPVNGIERAAAFYAAVLGSPFDVARARLLLAELDEARSDNGRTHLAAASAEFARCGAAPYLARCRSYPISTTT